MTTLSYPTFHLGHQFARLLALSGERHQARADATPNRVAARVSLECHGIHAVQGFEGGLIKCVEGCVWLTHDGDCRDVLLETGHVHVADRASRLVISALSRSTIRLVPRAVPISAMHSCAEPTAQLLRDAI